MSDPSTNEPSVSLPDPFGDARPIEPMLARARVLREEMWAEIFRATTILDESRRGPAAFGPVWVLLVQFAGRAVRELGLSPELHRRYHQHMQAAASQVVGKADCRARAHVYWLLAAEDEAAAARRTEEYLTRPEVKGAIDAVCRDELVSLSRWIRDEWHRRHALRLARELNEAGWTLDEFLDGLFTAYPSRTQLRDADAMFVADWIEEAQVAATAAGPVTAEFVQHEPCDSRELLSPVTTQITQIEDVSSGVPSPVNSAPAPAPAPAEALRTDVSQTINAQELEDFLAAADRLGLRGKQLQLVRQIAEKNGVRTITDLGVILGWDDAIGSWKSARTAINNKMRAEGWMLSQQDNKPRAKRCPVRNRKPKRRPHEGAKERHK